MKVTEEKNFEEEGNDKQEINEGNTNKNIFIPNELILYKQLKEPDTLYKINNSFEYLNQ